METPPPFTVDVRLTADGQIEIGASDEPGGVRGKGLCPSPDHPFGITGSMDGWSVPDGAELARLGHTFGGHVTGSEAGWAAVNPAGRPRRAGWSRR